MIGILSAIAILFTLLQLGVALANRAGNPNIPLLAGQDLSRISVLIPARNEAVNLPLLLQDLTHLSKSPLEILICDDHSTDNTFSIADHLAAHHPYIRVFRGAPLPPGWQGKNFACYQLARQAQGDYLLFLDADVRICGKDIEHTLTIAHQKNVGLLSVFPRQIMVSTGEKTTVPIMTYILLTLLPLPLVYQVSDQSALAAANGQYMLFEAAAYRRLQPHKQVKQEPTEDIAISRYYKKQGQRIACLCGIQGISCRMYRSRHEAIRGFSRNIAAFFGNSLLLAVLFWLFTTFGWIPVGFCCSWTGLIAYLAVRAAIRIIVSRACLQSVKENLYYATLQQINMLRIILQAFHNRQTGKQEWKGRNILKSTQS